MDKRKNERYVGPKLVPHDDPILTKHYADVLAVFPDAQFVMDGKVLRFRTNSLMRFFCDAHETYRGAPSMNDIVGEYFRGSFTINEMMQFAQDIGYSVGGFLELHSDEVTRMYKKGIKQYAGCRVVMPTKQPEEPKQE